MKGKSRKMQAIEFPEGVAILSGPMKLFGNVLVRGDSGSEIVSGALEAFDNNVAETTTWKPVG